MNMRNKYKESQLQQKVQWKYFVVRLKILLKEELQFVRHGEL